MTEECEDAAAVLRPDVELIQKRVQRKPEFAPLALDKISDPPDFEF